MLSLILPSRGISTLLHRTQYKLLKPVIRYRRYTKTTASLQKSPSSEQQVDCAVEGSPDNALMFSRETGCDLLGRDPGQDPALLDINFYDGQYFATDRQPHTPRLTLSDQMARVLYEGNQSEVPAVLFHTGFMKGACITFKGTEGEKLLSITAHGAKIMKKSLQDLE